MRGSGIALTAAIGGALLVPGSPLADQPPVPPTAALEAPSTVVVAGAALRLDSSHSRAGSGAIVGHVWDLDGNGTFETDTGTRPTVKVRPKTAGPLTVRVRIVDDRGQNSDAALALTVTAPPLMQAAPSSPPAVGGGRTATVSGAGGSIGSSSSGSGSGSTSRDGSTSARHSTSTSARHSTAASAPTAASGPGVAAHTSAPPPNTGAPTDPGTAPTGTPLTPAGPAPTTAAVVRMSAAHSLVPRPALARSSTAAPRTTPVASVHAAASTGVTIKNFAFAPTTSTVHVGDTITWTNQDQVAHTATASDGSFDTGSISQGKSGSHTFTKAGTIPYICSIHPSMKGTVTVLAAATTSSSGGSGGSSGTTPAPTPAATPSTSSGSGLPHTGLDIAAVVLLAMLMMGSGTLLRRRVGRAQ